MSIRSSELPAQGAIECNRIRSLSVGDDGRVKAIRWVFPVHGIPEIRSKESKGSLEVAFSCACNAYVVFPEK